MPPQTLFDLVDTLRRQKDLFRLILSPDMQFGSASAPRLGAELLPEYTRNKNAWTETQVRYRTTLARPTADFSPPILDKSGRLVGSFDVRLGTSSRASSMEAQDIEELNELLNLANQRSDTRLSDEALLRMYNWYDRELMQPIQDYNELQRWQAICDGEVERQIAEAPIGASPTAGRQKVVYPYFEGQRLPVPSGTTANPAGWYATMQSAQPYYDPLLDLIGVKRYLATKGYRLRRIISAYDPWLRFQQHPGIRARFQNLQFQTGSQVGTARLYQNSVSAAQVNQLLVDNDLPPFEVYDRTFNYRDLDGSIHYGRYLERETYFPIVFVCDTERMQMIDLGDRPTLELENTLGYYAIGRVMGHSQEGRVINTEVQDRRHPPSVYGEVIQMGLPVITEPESFAVLQIQKPTKV